MGAAAVAAWPGAESRAAEPIVPLALFRNRWYVLGIVIAIVLLFPGGLIEAATRLLALLQRRPPALGGDVPDKAGPA